MKHLFRILVFVVLAIALFDIVHAFQRIDTVLRMSDGVGLKVAYFLPDVLANVNGYPGILSVHGYAGSVNGNVELTQVYADSGYFAVTYTVRGQGRPGPATSSEGEFNWFTGEREMEDVLEILEWMGSRSDVNAERIAIEGISQGGLTTWGAIVNGFPVRCAVPMAAVPHYGETMIHNGCMNYFVRNIINLTRGGLVNMGPYIRDSIYNAYENDQYDLLANLLTRYEMIDRVGEISVPVFAQLAWQDDLFGTPSLFRTFREMNAPLKMMVVPGGHGGVTNNFLDYRMTQTMRFYRRWLLDDEVETIMNEDSLVTFVDGADSTYHSFGPDEAWRYIPTGFGEGEGVTFYFDTGNTLSEEQPVGNVRLTRAYIQGITNDIVVFRSEPLANTIRMIGAEVSLVASSNAQKWQANVFLWDYNPATDTRKGITRGAWEARDGGAERRVEYQLSPELYTLEAGHILEARLKPGMPVLKPTDEFGKAPVAPQASAINTFISNGEKPSWVKILVPDEMTTSSPRSPVPQSIPVTLSQNPVRTGEDVRVRFDLLQRGVTVEVLDVMGRRVLAADRIDGQFSFSTGGWSRGYYVILVRDGDSALGSAQLILQ